MDQELKQPGSDYEPPRFDERGPIPDYPRRRYDEDGRPLPFTPEENALRVEIYKRRMAVIDVEDNDPPGTDEALMKAIDSNYPEGMKLFEGMY